MKMNPTSFLRESRNWRQTTELKIRIDVIRQKEQHESNSSRGTNSGVQDG